MSRIRVSIGVLPTRRTKNNCSMTCERDEGEEEWGESVGLERRHSLGDEMDNIRIKLKGTICGWESTHLRRDSP